MQRVRAVRRQRCSDMLAQHAFVLHQRQVRHSCRPKPRRVQRLRAMHSRRHRADRGSDATARDGRRVHARDASRLHPQRVHHNRRCCGQDAVQGVRAMCHGGPGDLFAQHAFVLHQRQVYHDRRPGQERVQRLRAVCGSRRQPVHCPAQERVRLPGLQDYGRLEPAAVQDVWAVRGARGRTVHSQHERPLHQHKVPDHRRPFQGGVQGLRIVRDFRPRVHHRTARQLRPQRMQDHRRRRLGNEDAVQRVRAVRRPWRRNVHPEHEDVLYQCKVHHRRRPDQSAMQRVCAVRRPGNSRKYHDNRATTTSRWRVHGRFEGKLYAHAVRHHWGRGHQGGVQGV